MLKSGAEHLESLRDGRRVYVGSEEVDDVTAHPAFRSAAGTVAAIYDMKRAPENLDVASYVENGERYSSYYLRARSQDDLWKRTQTHKKIADLTFGLFGRSTDHVAGLLTGLAMKADVLDEGPGFRDNLLRHYDDMRRDDVYASYAVIPPAGVRHADVYSGEKREDPGLRVVDEDDSGVVLTGMKMLATGAVFSNEILIGNLTPLAAEFKDYAITCALPCNAPGLGMWARRPYALTTPSEIDYPLSFRFDETDVVIVCDRVKVPWENVFIHNDAELSRGCYVMTPANCFSNHQSNVRYWSKLSMLVGLASRICQSSGNDKIPAVREQLGRLAALEGAIAAMVHGQVMAFEDWPGGPDGYVCFNRRYMYATLNWCTEHYSAIIDLVRELCGGHVLQMPADSSVLTDAALRPQFEAFFATPFMEPILRWKLLKLAWDMIGSEFAGRHTLYEKFYGGNSVIVRNQSFREAPWDDFHAIVDDMLEAVPVPPLQP
jgi:4-hydroxyphenylacetate 3-monooxygenase